VNDKPAGEQTLVGHLLELRSRLLKCSYGFLLALVPALYWSQELYQLLASPLLRFLPAGSSMIATEVASPFFAPVKLAAVAAFAGAMPWVLYQVWAFVAPGLYQTERRLVVPLLVSSTVLFYLGIAFAYFAVLPAVFHFVIGVAPAGVAVMTDITKYLDFALALFIVFGVAFETPVAIVLLAWTGFVTPRQLAEARPYVCVGAFVVAAILTPPDVWSQVLLAVSILVLYEVGIIAARLLVPGAKQVDEQRANKMSS
jgi:sec-independent protein translocase protein TatC